MIDLVLLILVAITGIGALQSRDLIAATMLMGAYSLLMCLVWMRLNAVDVAFTESAVGAGISAVLLIGAISRTKRHEAVRPRPRGILRRYVPLLAVCATGALLLYGTLDMPDYGDGASPANSNPEMAQYYLTQSPGDMGAKMPNVVTAVLAHYRGYDTMGETTVIFVAAMVVIILLRPLRRRKEEPPAPAGDAPAAAVGGADPPAPAGDTADPGAPPAGGTA
jgi:multicomponent Na+:H+ antiporter subunit B